jgi:glycerophosphoryl diester phosphodiesterase
MVTSLREARAVRRSAINIAHRGASGTFPENTLSAFRAAADAGARMCELDVQLTRDRQVVVIHDDTVDRTTEGAGEVAAMTLAELKRLDAGAKFKGGAARRESIPTLDEVFDAIAERCALNIELKAGGVEAKVAAIIREHRAIESSMVSSFDWGSIAVIKRIDPEIRFGLLAEKKPDELLDRAIEMKAYAINPRFDMVTAELCAAAHRANLKVLTWTVDVPHLMEFLLDAGVDGIMTNYPDRLRDVLAA